MAASLLLLFAFLASGLGSLRRLSATSRQRATPGKLMACMLSATFADLILGRLGGRSTCLKSRLNNHFICFPRRPETEVRTQTVMKTSEPVLCFACLLL